MNLERLQNLAKKIHNNEYEVEVFNTKEEARDYIVQKCLNKKVGISDSHTIKEMGLLEILKNQSKELYVCQLDKSRENKLKTLTAEILLLSANAVSEETGELVNIDSSCNRVAASLYGPNEVIFVIGKNKIEKNLADAINRAKNIAAPMNSKVHNYQTPCVITGKCENCSAYDRICRATVIYHKKPKSMISTVILVNDNLGF